MGEMKQIKRDPMRFDVFSVYGLESGTQSLHAPGALNDFIAKIRDSVENSLQNEAFLHGKRVENMFENVVVALGNVQFIKAEDAGDGWHSADNLAVPDFRVVLQTQEQFLVEVKNFHGDPFKEPYILASTYVEGLRSYGQIVGSPVRLAVYWSRLNKWTMFPLESLRLEDTTCRISFGDAMMDNLMVSIGDIMVGTTPPLELHFVAEKNEPRSIKDGKAIMTIGAVKLFCGGCEIVEERERKIATSLMMFGEWEETETLVCDDEGLPSHIAYNSYPTEGETDQGFAIVGVLSSMYSRKFAYSTIENGRVARIDSRVRPDAWGSMIPRDYESKTLPLWRFMIGPRPKEV